MYVENSLLLNMLVEQARKAKFYPNIPWQQPAPGDLVVEVTTFSRDPDAIGWLIGTGQAAYNADGTGPTRLIWDVVPLSGARGRSTLYQRWENSEFVRVNTTVHLPMPAEVAELVDDMRRRLALDTSAVIGKV